MAYIGTSPSNGVRRRFTYDATSGQTSFSGNDENGIALTYVDSLYLDVYQNGVKLKAGDDYAATTGTTVVLAVGATTNDVVEMVSFDVFSVNDSVSASAGGSFAGAIGMGSTLAVTGNATVGGTLGVTGAVTLTGGSTLTGALTQKGGAVFNEDSADVDFRVESNGDANCLFVDGGNDKVGVGTNSPNSKLTSQTASDSDTAFSFAAQLNNARASNSSIAALGFHNRADANATGVGAAIALLGGGTAGGSGSLIFSIKDATDIANVVDVADEKMRIDSAGNVGIGTTSSTSKLHIVADGNVVACCRMNNTQSGTGASNTIIFQRGGTNVGFIKVTGSATSYVTSSDYRLKENVSYDFDATKRLKQLKPSRFNFIADADITVDGFLAHEVQSVVPEAITGTKDEVDDDGKAVMQGIDQSKLVPLLVKTIQELEARITALENA